MYDTAKCVELVKLRAQELHRREKKRRISALSALCVILFASFVGTISAVTGPGQLVMWGMYGAMLLREDAGGYVLVGVIAFAAAVVVTLLCIRYKEKSERDQHPGGREEKDP